MAQNNKEFDPNMRGALFLNDKQGNPKRPDYTGPLVIDGQEYRVAGWVRKGKDGAKYLGIVVEPRKAKQDKAEEIPADQLF